MKDKNSSYECQRCLENNESAMKIKTLSEEIVRLKSLVSKVADSMSWGNHVMKIVFRDESFEEKYKSKLTSYLKETLEKGDTFSMSSLIADRAEQEFNKHRKLFDAEKIKSTPRQQSSKKVIPLYSSEYNGILEPEQDKPEEQKDEKLPSVTCFNCLGGHHMKDCPEAIDRLRVAANKKDLMQDNNTTRYHDEEKKNAAKPGKISEEVRLALGLQNSQLPEYIYKMRVVGYPPGWMSDAQCETSLSLYDGDGNAEQQLDSDAENQYDSSKFIEYPGFNCPCPPDVKDEWKNFGLVPMQSHHQLAEMIKSSNMAEQSTSSKRKSTSVEESSKRMKNGTTDDTDPLQWSPEISSTPKKQDSPSQPEQTPPNLNATPISKSLSASISRSPGTPVVHQGNPHRRLPDPDKFARDITEHLPFENLPDAVGKYDKMRDIISGVHKKLRNLKKES